MRGPIVLFAAGLILPWIGGCGGNNTSDESLFQKFFPPTPGQVARDAFNVYDPDQRRRSVNMLANAPWGGEGPYLRTYRLLVDDPDPTVRAACIRALGKHGEAADALLVLPYMKDKANYVRWECVTALQRLHNSAAVDPLVVALRDDLEAEVRTVAANALGQYPQPKVFPALVGALNDDDYAVVNESLGSLQLLTGQKLGEDGSEWLEWSKETQDLFADRRPYYYPQYVRPPGFMDKVQFWKDREEVVPRQPTGIAGTTANGESAAPSAAPSQTEPKATAGEAAKPSTAAAPDARENRPEAIAVVSKLDNAQWAAGATAHAAGAGLSRGAVKLESGAATLDFRSGASVTLYGPGEFEVSSDARGYLRDGKLSVVVPAKSEPFMLKLPSLTAIVPEGSTVGVLTGSDGVVSIHALRGGVTLSLVTPDSGIVKQMHLGKGKSALVAKDGSIKSGRADYKLFE